MEHNTKQHNLIVKLLCSCSSLAEDVGNGSILEKDSGVGRVVSIICLNYKDGGSMSVYRE